MRVSNVRTSEALALNELTCMNASSKWRQDHTIQPTTLYSLHMLLGMVTLRHSFGLDLLYYNLHDTYGSHYNGLGILYVIHTHKDLQQSASCTQIVTISSQVHGAANI
jgi:hypothetical protein